jgi:hypothetical protein
MIATLPANACRNLATGVLLGLKSSIPSLRLTALFWRFFGSSIVLVLSEAVLVIDVSVVRRAGFGDTFVFHCHSSQHRDDPMQHRFHRSNLLKPDAFHRHQHVLNRVTIQNQISSDVEKWSTIFAAPLAAENLFIKVAVDW